MSPIRLFTDHPSTVGESYGQHFLAACGFGLRMVAGGLACLVHALLPFLFVTTGSRTISRLYDRMVVHRHGNLPTRKEAIEQA
jgi:hypothetical protein